MIELENSFRSFILANSDILQIRCDTLSTHKVIY